MTCTFIPPGRARIPPFQGRLRTLSVLLVACLLWGFSMGAQAFGLGPITVYSTASEPLRADIELLATRADQLGDIHAALASEREFEWVGVPKRAVLDQLRFRPMVDPQGRPVIRITSPRPVGEDFLHFLVEVSGPNGHLVREYTVLQGQGPAAETGRRPPPPQTAASLRPSPAGPDALIRRVGPQRASTPARHAPPPAKVVRGTRQPPTPAPAEQALPREYLAQRGDSLFRIGRRYTRAAGVSTRLMAQAIFHSNPRAFVSADMNRLKAGALLQIPAPEAVPRLAALSTTAPPAKAPAPQVSPSPAAKAAAPPASLPAPSSVPAMSPARASPPAEVGGPAVEETATTPTPAPVPAEAKAEPALEIVGKDEPKVASTQSPAAERASALYVAQLEKTVQLAQELAKSRRQENTSLKGHIDRLNAVLNKQERLIELQNTQMTELRHRLEAAIAATDTPRPEPWYLLVALLAVLSTVSALIAGRLWWVSRRAAAPVQARPADTTQSATQD